jgi:hypothetical protein
MAWKEGERMLKDRDCSGGQETEFRSQNGNTVAANMRNGLANEEKRKGDQLRFYSIVQGSIEESRTDLILAKDLAHGVFPS